MFSNRQLKDWFKNLVNPLELEFIHPTEDDNTPNASRDFHNYIGEIENEGFKVWDIRNRLDANTRLVLKCDNRSVIISGRPDYLICERNSNLGDYLMKTRCVIELQSNDDEESCELQLMAYIYVFMNRHGLEQLVGFLIYRDGQVRAYKASRDPDIVYEENDRFHIQHILDILRQLTSN